MTITDYTDIPKYDTIKHDEYIDFNFKHHRDNDDKLFATTCTFINQDGKVVAIGVSLCNSKDNFNRKTGRSISFNRGLKAYMSKRNQFPIKRKDCLVIEKCLNYIGLEYKACYFNHKEGSNE